MAKQHMSRIFKKCSPEHRKIEENCSKKERNYKYANPTLLLPPEIIIICNVIVNVCILQLYIPSFYK